MKELGRRGRALTALLFVIAGGIGIISSTQTWFTVVRVDGAADVPVAGADAMPVLAPLSLAVLALSAAIAIVGPVMRIVFAIIAMLIAGSLGTATLVVALEHPVSAVASTLSELVGLMGEEALAPMIASITGTPWPCIALVAWVILFLGGIFALLTARHWKVGGRRFQTSSSTPHDGPIDAVESWDDLSHGTDPTR